MWGIRVFLLIAAVLPAVSAASRPDIAAPPNVVLIISDDQTYRDFGFMGNDQVQTPHLDRLAAKSARFVNGYVPTSVCSPSLASILTGLYPHQHGIHYNHPPPGNSRFNKMESVDEYVRVRSESFYLIKSTPTLPRLLTQRGYRSLQTGKFWEGHYSNAGFTEGMTLFTAPRGQKYGGLRTLANGELAAHGNGDWGLKIGRETMQPIFDFIDRRVGKAPFFVWYAPYLPHQPHDSPRRYFDLYKDRPEIPAHFVPYYAAISQFDDTVGELVQFVEQKGQAKNTLFVFVVDNGWTPGLRKHKTEPDFFFHTKGSKRSPFADGLRTPILLRWDGVVTPKTHTQLVSSIDLAPTILSACGVNQKDQRLPGIDLRAASKNAADRPVFGEIYPGDATSLGNPSRDVAYRWVRQGDFRLVVPHAQRGQKPWGDYLNRVALYDVERDPDEKTNLAEDPQQQTRLRQLRALLDDWWTPGDDAGVPKPSNTSLARALPVNPKPRIPSLLRQRGRGETKIVHGVECPSYIRRLLFRFQPGHQLVQRDLLVVASLDVFKFWPLFGG